MAVKQVWTGRAFEDFEVGDVYDHPLGRTILAADNTWFTLLTMNTNPIHFDTEYAARTEFGKRLVNSVRSPDGIRKTAGQFLFDAGSRDRTISHRSLSERVSEP